MIVQAPFHPAAAVRVAPPGSRCVPDVLAISSTDTRYNIQLSSTDLLSCHRVSQIFMCDSFEVMSKRFDDTCLGALYMQKFEAAQNLCKFKVILVEEQEYQLCKGLFMVYVLEPTTASIKCRMELTLSYT
jgi:hypothetical protein